MSPRTGSTIFGVPTSRRASLADSYNGEIYEADAARFIPVESARNWPLRAQVRSILRNGVARRTLHVTVLFGIVTIIYQGISLIPSFGGIEYLARSDVTSRQTVAYAFLQECANHKVRTRTTARIVGIYQLHADEWPQLYNLPLGPDCLKYLAMTPKAPPDIDKWMVDPPPSIPMKIRRAAREIILAARKIVTYEVEVRELTEPHYDAPFRGILVGNELMLSATLLASIYIFHPHLRRAASRLDSWIIGEIYLRWRNTVEVMRHFLRMSMVSFCLFTWFYLLGELFYVPTGWAATSEFLDTCKILEVRYPSFHPRLNC